MKNNQEEAQWLENAMNSLDMINRVEANPFFYGKIQHRIAGKQSPKGAGKLIYSLALTLIIFIIMNVYSLSSFVNSTSQDVGSTGIESFASDYNINATGDNF